MSKEFSPELDPLWQCSKYRDERRQVANWMGEAPKVLWAVRHPKFSHWLIATQDKNEAEELLNFELETRPESDKALLRLVEIEVFPDYLGVEITTDDQLRFVLWALTQLQFCKLLMPAADDSDKSWMVETVDGAHPFKISAKAESLPLALYSAMRQYLRFKEEGPAYL